jgi:hypothetical protein
LSTQVAIKTALTRPLPKSDAKLKAEIWLSATNAAASHSFKEHCADATFSMVNRRSVATATKPLGSIAA